MKSAYQPNGSLARTSGPQQFHRVPGWIKDGRLVKEVKRGRHFLRWLRGYAWSLEQLEKAKLRGVHTLELREDSGRVLQVGINYLFEKGERFQHGLYEQQVGLPESSMTAYDPAQPDLFGGTA